MSKSKNKVEYRVTVQDQDGNFSVQEHLEDAPLKGDTYEYTHTEVRIGQVTKVEKIETDKDGHISIANVTELGDTHHALEDPEDGDDFPEIEDLVGDPVDEDNPSTTGTASEQDTAEPTPLTDNPNSPSS